MSHAFQSVVVVVVSVGLVVALVGRLGALLVVDAERKLLRVRVAIGRALRVARRVLVELILRIRAGLLCFPNFKR